MNIIDAIKSGKLHKRKINREWCHAPSVTNQFSLTYSIDDILANDWEVEKKQVTITESDFESAVDRATQSFSMYDPPHIREYLTQLKKELGL